MALCNADYTRYLEPYTTAASACVHVGGHARDVIESGYR